MQRFDRWYRGLALAAGVVATAILVASAGASGARSGGSAATCKPYGTLSYGIAGAGITALDPNTIAAAAQWPLNSLVYEGLTTYDQDGNAVPDLATRWKHSADDKTWWFFLRRDVHYQDGRPFTSADVVQNILRVLDPKVPSQARGNIKDIQSVRAINKYEVRFRLGSPSSILPDQLFLVRMSDLTHPDQLNTVGLGTGPYMVSKFEPNQSLILVPSTHYSGPKSQCFAQIAFLREPDPTSMVTDFTAGKLGMAFNVPISAVPQVNSDKNAYIIQPKAISSLDAWEVDTTSPPFSNPQVRQGLSFAIDRDAMVKVALQGQGVPAIGNSLINEKNPFYNGQLKGYPFDLDKAKALFQHAGLAPGTTFTYWTQANARPEWLTMGEILQQDLQKIGYNLNIVQSDPSTWLAKFFPNPKQFPGLIVANFLSLQPNPVLGMSFASSNKCECNWNNKAYDALYFKALGATDNVTLKKYVNAMQGMFSAAAPVLPIADATNIVAVQKGVQGVWQDPRGNVHMENAYFANAKGSAK